MRLKNLIPHTIGLAIALPVFSLVWGAGPVDYNNSAREAKLTGLTVDTPDLHYPFDDRLTDPYSNTFDQSPLYGTDPSNIHSTIEYDPDNQEYIINEKMGSLFYRNPSYMTFQEYVDEEFNKTTKQYWRQRSGEDVLGKEVLTYQNLSSEEEVIIGNNLTQGIYSARVTQAGLSRVVKLIKN